jgi:hypothetical protein
MDLFDVDDLVSDDGNLLHVSSGVGIDMSTSSVSHFGNLDDMSTSSNNSSHLRNVSPSDVGSSPGVGALLVVEISLEAAFETADDLFIVLFMDVAVLFDDVDGVFSNVGKLPHDVVFSRDSVLPENVLDMSVDVSDLDALGMLQVRHHVVDDLDGLLLAEVLDVELMSDHVHDLCLHLGVESGTIALFLAANNLVHMGNVGDILVGDGCDVGSVDMVHLEEMSDVSADSASLDVLGSSQVVPEFVKNSDKLLAVDGFLQQVISIQDGFVLQDVSDGSIDSLGRPFLLFASIGDLSLKLLP